MFVSGNQQNPYVTQKHFSNQFLEKVKNSEIKKSALEILSESKRLSTLKSSLSSNDLQQTSAEDSGAINSTSVGSVSLGLSNMAASYATLSGMLTQFKDEVSGLSDPSFDGSAEQYNNIMQKALAENNGSSGDTKDYSNVDFAQQAILDQFYEDYQKAQAGGQTGTSTTNGKNFSGITEDISSYAASLHESTADYEKSLLKEYASKQVDSVPSIISGLVSAASKMIQTSTQSALHGNENMSSVLRNIQNTVDQELGTNKYDFTDVSLKGLGLVGLGSNANEMLDKLNNAIDLLQTFHNAICSAITPYSSGSNLFAYGLDTKA